MPVIGRPSIRQYRTVTSRARMDNCPTMSRYCRTAPARVTVTPTVPVAAFTVTVPEFAPVASTSVPAFVIFVR
ncbi:hypothetical protein AAFH96_26210 [Polymorphospora sp. 2-325]|uniref:Uncharacterized protein n=1 Tax=Polymorphospora lycopeni TaxID=3140240 RepID=A0ABV5CX35_9ACTN